MVFKNCLAAMLLPSLSLFACLPALVACADSSELRCPENNDSSSCSGQPAKGANLLQVGISAQQLAKPHHVLQKNSDPIDASNAQHERSNLHMLGVPSSGGPVVPKEHREAALRDTVKLFTDSGVTFFAGAGVALGLIRDGSLLAHDDDIDLFVAADTFHLAAKVLKEFREDLVVELDRDHFVRVHAPDWGPVDLYSLEPVDATKVKDPAEADLLCERQDKVMVNASVAFPAVLVDIQSVPGVGVPIPHLPEAYALHFYGAEWRTPQDHSKADLPAVRLRDTELFERLCAPSETAIEAVKLSSPPSETETAKLRAKAFRAVAQDDAPTLQSILDSVTQDIWTPWKNKAGKDLLALSEEHNSSLAYAALAKAGAHGFMLTQIEDQVNGRDKLTSLSIAVLPSTRFNLVGTDIEKTMAIGLLLPLAIICWLAWHSWGHRGAAPMRNPSDFVVPCMYIVMSAGSTLSLRQTRGSSAQSTLEACLLIYLLKVLISLGLVFAKQRVSLEATMKTLMSKDEGAYLPVWVNLALVGSLFAGYDALSLFARQQMPPTTFQLLINSRALLIVPLQWAVLGKSIAVLQFCALLLIGVGACALSIGDITAASADDADADLKATQSEYIVGVFLIVGKIIVGAVALVVSEKQLKQLPLTVDTQNFITYGFGMFFMGCGVTVWTLFQPAATSYDMVSAMGQIFLNPWMFGSVLSMAILGLVCAYLLKSWSALWKEVFSAGVVVLLAIGQSFTPGEHGFGLRTLECALIITLGVAAYILNEPAAKPEAAREAAPEGSAPEAARAKSES